MREAEFNAIYEELTPRQRKVVQAFLAGETDEGIATSLYVEAATVRRHLANICKEFGLSNPEGEHYSYRDELIKLFARYRPETVNPRLIGGQGSFQPDLERRSMNGRGNHGGIAPTGVRGSAPTKNQCFGDYWTDALEFPGSPLPVESPFYVKRSPIEERCAREILKPGALIRIRAPKRMGKTSLLNRIVADAKTLGYHALRLDLRQAEEQFLTSLDTFLQWFCVNVSRKLELPPELDDYWDERFGSIVSCTTYFQSHLLGQLNNCLLLGLDEVDWLFEASKIAQGFFALLRSWHEEANNLEIWQQLRLVVVHSTEVYIPLNINQSPFNVGLPIRLSELTPEQVQELAQQYGIRWSASSEVERLTAMVGGHPYLVQLALYHLHSGEMTLDELLQTAPTQAGIYGNDLRRHWQTLQGHPELMAALKSAICCKQQRFAIEAQTTGVQLEPTLAYKLESMGLVQLRGNEARVSCELYRQYFRNCLL